MSSFFPLEPTAENIGAARDFVFRMWCERHEERGQPQPADLSGSCKFSSMFAAHVFGARMRGNEDHQFCHLPDGEILDLNREAQDVAQLARLCDPWRHDRRFWNNPDHREAMDSCKARVKTWIRRFAEELAAAAEPEAGMAGP